MNDALPTLPLPSAEQIDAFNAAINGASAAGILIAGMICLVLITRYAFPFFTTLLQRNGNRHMREEAYEAGERDARQAQILEELKVIATLLREQGESQQKALAALDYISKRVGDVFHWIPSAKSVMDAHGDFINRVEARVTSLEQKKG